VLQYDEGNGKSRPKTMPKFSACIEHVGGPWYLPRLLFVARYLWHIVTNAGYLELWRLELRVQHLPTKDKIF
jgi:hypothetical protein